jgi:hypothetical protein
VVKSPSEDVISEEQRQCTHLRLQRWVVSQATHFGMNSSAIISPWGTAQLRSREKRRSEYIHYFIKVSAFCRAEATKKPAPELQPEFFLSCFTLYFNLTMEKGKNTSSFSYSSIHLLKV